MIQAVAFRLGERHFALPIGIVKEVLKSFSLTRLPQASPHVAGVMNLRGMIVPVVDLRIFLEVSEYSLRPHLVVAELGKEWVGFMVDKILPVCWLPPDSPSLLHLAALFRRDEEISLL
ncbi:MAG TPA: hypothetical protein DD435_00105 [Cyanobacteria bacterium UBA8530]|nr:hypothetical protein [Cyanobacteria bacterium UBA8530]